MVDNKINVTVECKIGAGAVVVRDITEIGMYVGVLAVKVNGEKALSIN